MNFYWSGTDSLMLVDYSRRTFLERVHFMVFRLFVKMGEKFIGVHYVNSETVETNLITFGVKRPIVYVTSQIKYTEPIAKQPHRGFNVLYYSPTAGNQKFNKWLYGYDVFEAVRDALDVNFIVVDGTQDMEEIYPIIDFCLRCNRHDGNSRMIRECKIQGIPYYWSQTDPDYWDIIQSINEERLHTN